MTAMLNALRTLDARLDRGEITPEEYARRRTALLSSAEDAETDFIDVTPHDSGPKPRQTGAAVHARRRNASASATAELPGASSAAGLGLVVVLAVMGVCIALALIFLDNMNLALTLGVTILAAISVALMRNSDG